MQRSNKSLQLISDIQNWVSPLLGIRFQLTADILEIYRSDGERFLTYIELGEQLAAERAQRAQDQQRIQTLEAKLRELGINPKYL